MENLYFSFEIVDSRASTSIVDGKTGKLPKGDKGIDIVVSVEARGFILGPAIAYKLGAGVVPVRKKGKLPWRCYQETYDLEYGTDILEIHQDAIKPGEKVLIVDDLLATGGTVGAVIDLVERLPEHS